MFITGRIFRSQRMPTLLLLVAAALAATGPFASAKEALDTDAGARVTALVEAARSKARAIRGGARACEGPQRERVAAIPGFAGEAGTTGGLGGETVVVTSDRDFVKGTALISGTLRAAIEYGARRKAPTTVVFAPEMAGRTITLAAPLRPGDDTTIDGGCSGVTLIADADQALVILSGRRNVVIEGLTFRKHPYAGENKGRVDHRDFRDCITVAGSVDRLAFLHNDFEACGDGEIDITSGVGKAMPKAGGRITVAYNRFGPHDKAMLLGTDGCVDAATSLDAGCPIFGRGDAALDPLYQVTLHGNFFEWTGQRNPKVFGRVLLESVSNVFAFRPYDRKNGTTGTTYGTYAAMGARVFSRGNVYLGVPFAGHRPMGLYTTTTEGGVVNPRDGEGAIRSIGDLGVDGAVVDEHRPDLVPDLERRAAARPASLDVRALGARDAIACVAVRAGPSGTDGWPRETCGH